jgi:hypothetical protein
MCKYCKQTHDGGEILAQDTVSLGPLGKIEVTQELWTYGCEEPFLAVSAFFQTIDNSGDSLVWEKMPIMYCPFCGQKIGRDGE